MRILINYNDGIFLNETYDLRIFRLQFEYDYVTVQPKQLTNVLYSNDNIRLYNSFITYKQL